MSDGTETNDSSRRLEPSAISLPLPLKRRVDKICDQFEAAWNSGQRPNIEDYLGATPDPERSALLQELIKLDVEMRRLSGEQPQVLEYRARFPSLVLQVIAAIVEPPLAAKQGTSGGAESIKRGSDEATASLAVQASENFARRQDFVGRIDNPAHVVAAGEARAKPRRANDPGDGADFGDSTAAPEQEAARESASRHAMQPLRRFGDYELLEEIARGGMGIVYRARQVKLNRVVAVKMILTGQLASEDDVRRFYAEAEAAASLEHPGIVPIHEVNEFEGQHYFSMGYVDGPSLARRLATGPLPPREAAALIKTVAEAVEYAHERGIIHRDLKPQNILMTGQGEPRVTDFGLAKSVKADIGLTATGQILGTPSYMPPEQAAGRMQDVGPPSDVYALGAVLYCSLTGRPPFQSANVMDTLRQVLERAPVSPRQLNPVVDKDLETICLKCLEKDKANRFPTARALADELQRFLNGEPIHSRRVGLAGRAWRWSRRKPLAAALCASVLIVIAALTVAGWMANKASLTTRLADLNQRFETGLDRPKLTGDYLGEMERIVTALSAIAPERVPDAKVRLYDRFTATIRSEIDKSRLTQADVPPLQVAIDSLRRRFPDEAADLDKRLQSRLSDWTQVFAVSTPFAEQDAVFGTAVRQHDRGLVPSATVGRIDNPSHVGRQDGGLVPSAKTDGRSDVPLVLTQIPCSATARLEAVFESNSLSAGQIGLLLNASETAGYVFRLRLSESAPSVLPESRRTTTQSLEEVESSENVLTVEILRNNAPLVRHHVPAAGIPTGSLTLRATREENLLSFQINDLPPWKFHDPFPLRGSSQGMFGLSWPSAVPLVEVRAFQKLTPELPSALQQGDDLYDQGKISEALGYYQRIEPEARDAELQQEARYKQALCLIALNRSDEAAPVLERLVTLSGDRWPPLAGCQLWALRLRQKRLTEAEAIFELLSARFQFEQLTAVIPTEVRQEIIGGYIKVFTTAAGVLRFDPDRVRNMERLAAVDRFLSPDGRGTAYRQLEVVRAYRYVGDFNRALEVCEQIVSIFNDDWLVFRHYARLLRLTGKSERALAVVRQAIAGQSESGWNVAILRIERARVLAALSRWDEAEEGIDELLPSLQPDVWGDRQMLSYAYLIKGFLQERRGNHAAAFATWRRGFETVRPLILQMPAASTEMVNTMILGSLSNQLTSDETSAFFGKLGVAGDSGSVVALIAPLVNPQSLTAAFRAMWRSPRGRQYAEAFAFETTSLSDRARIPVVLGMAEFTHQQAFGGHATAEQDEIIWAMAEELFSRRYVTGDLVPGQSVQLGLTWRGTTSLLGWAGVAPSLPPSFRARMAYVLAHRFIRRSDLPQARAFFQMAAQDAETESPLARLALADADLVMAGKAQLTFDNEFPDPVQVAVLQNGKPVETVTVSQTAQIKLPAGTYQLAFAAPQASLSLSTTKLTLQPADRPNIRVQWLWRPAQNDHAFRGVVPQPARLPNIGRWQITHTHPNFRANVVEWSPGGTQVACSGDDGLIRIFDAESKSLVRLLPGTGLLITSLTWHPDGRRLVSASYDNALRVWDAVDGKLLRVLRSQEHGIGCVAWSPDGQWLAAGHFHRFVRLWRADGTTGPVLTGFGDKTAAPDHRAIAALAWSPDSRQLAVAAKGDRALRIWNVQNVQPTATVLELHDVDGSELAWSTDGQRLAVGDTSQSIQLLDTSNWNVVRTWPGSAAVLASLQWEPGGQRLAATDRGGRVRIWDFSDTDTDANSDAAITIQTTPVEASAWSPKGGQLVTLGWNLLRFWNANGTPASSVGSWWRNVMCVDWSPNADTIAAGCTDSTLRLFDATGRPGPVLKGHSGNVLDVAFSPDGSHIATAGGDRTIRLWSLDGKPGPVCVGHAGPVRALEWSPDGRQIASASDDKTIRLWSLVGKPGPVLTGHDLGVRAVVWSSDGGQLASADSQKTICLWNADGRLRHQFQTGKANTSALLQMPDDDLAVLDQHGTISFWHSDGSPGRTWQAHQGYSTACARSGDGQRLASAGSYDRTVRVWKPDGTAQSVLIGHAYGAIWRLAFSPDGRHVVSGGEDGMIRIWDVESGQPERVIAVLANDASVTFNPSGEIVHSAPEAEADLVYFFETEEDTIEVLPASKFFEKLQSATPTAGSAQ